MIGRATFRRLRAGLLCDLRLQARHGLLLVAGLTGLAVGLALGALPGASARALLPAALLNSLVLSGYYFMAGTLLLERDEGALAARGPTPLRPAELLAARLAALAALNLLEGLLAIGLAGLPTAPLPAALGLALATSAFALLGCIVAARAASLSDMLLPSVLAVAPLAALPPLALAGWWHPALLLHPLAAPLLLMGAAPAPAAGIELAIALAACLAWLLALWRAALRAIAGALSGGG